MKVSGDLLGKYTCYNVKGSSTVDLFITSYALLSNIIQLKVSTARFRSCHCVMNMTMKVDQLVIEEPMLHEFPPIFFWNNLYKRHLVVYIMGVLAQFSFMVEMSWYCMRILAQNHHRV